MHAETEAPMQQMSKQGEKKQEEGADALLL